MSNAGAITYEDVGLSPDETNMLVDGLLSIGLDIRVQGARLGSPTIDEATNETVYPGMTFFPMQFQPYVTVTPADGLTIYGTYLPGPDSFKEDNGVCDPVFAGMACYEGYVMYEPESTWPTVRAGCFNLRDWYSSWTITPCLSAGTPMTAVVQSSRPTTLSQASRSSPNRSRGSAWKPVVTSPQA